MAYKMAATYVYAVVVTLTQSFLIGFFSNFTYGLLLLNSCSSLHRGFVWCRIIKMADIMAAAYQFVLVCGVVVTLTQSFKIRFLSN